MCKAKMDTGARCGRWLARMACLLGLALPAATAQAISLNLALGLPDIMSSFITVNYTAASDLLAADGFATELTDAGGTTSIMSGTFSLMATIDDSGTASSGSLTISGDVGSGVQTLLSSSTLSQFGFPTGGGDPLEFVFTNLDGSLAAQFGSRAGVVLSSSGFPMPPPAPPFSADFSSNIAVSDVGTLQVPAPATLPLLMIGLLGLFAVHNRKA